MELTAGFKRTAAGVFPEDWVVSSVGNEFEVKLGKMLDAARNAGVPKPYIGNRAVQWGAIDVCDLPTVPMSDRDIEMFRLRVGDLLVCEGGEVGRAAIWDAPIDECYYQKALHRLRPIRGFDSRFMLALLEFWASHGVFADYVTQTSIAHLPRERFMEVPLPAPSASEQRAIATALSDVDALLLKLNQLITKKRDLKLGAVQELIHGWRRLPGFNDKWTQQQLGRCASFLKGKGLSKSDLVENGREPCIHYGELFTHYPETISAIKSRTDWQEGVFRSEANDVLMPTSDVTPTGLARASCIPRSGVILGGDILVIRTARSALCGSFLSYLIRSSKPQILQRVTGTTVFHLYGANLADFTFQAPPTVEEQKAIVRTLDEMDAEIAALEARRDKTHALKKGMMQELLTGRIRLV